MPMDDKRLDEQLKAVFEEQGRAARLSQKQLARLTDAVVQGAQQRSGWRSFIHDARRWLSRLWYGETFISWRALGVTGAAAIVLIVSLQTPPAAPRPTIQRPPTAVPAVIAEAELGESEQAAPQLLAMERVELPAKFSQGM